MAGNVVLDLTHGRSRSRRRRRRLLCMSLAGCLGMLGALLFSYGGASTCVRVCVCVCVRAWKCLEMDL